MAIKEREILMDGARIGVMRHRSKRHLANNASSWCAHIDRNPQLGIGGPLCASSQAALVAQITRHLDRYLRRDDTPVVTYGPWTVIAE